MLKLTRMAKPTVDLTSDEVDTITMRELGKLSAEQIGQLEHPVRVTNNGLPVAWLVPLSGSQRRRAQLIAAGRIRPRRVDGPPPTPPLQYKTDGPTLTELLLEMRGQERT